MEDDDIEAWYQKGVRALEAHKNPYDLGNVRHAHLQQQRIDVFDLAKRAQPYIDKLRKRVKYINMHPKKVRRVAKLGQNRYILMNIPKDEKKKEAAHYALVNVKSELQLECRQRFGAKCFIGFGNKSFHLVWF